MVYLFGDLRQLRKFELTRPTISRPIPMPISHPTPFRSTRASGQPLFIPSHRAPLPEKATRSGLSFDDSPISFVAPAQPRAQFSDVSLRRTSCGSEVCSSVGSNEIDVSPAFFDDVPAPEGPATASCLHRPEYRLSPPSIAYLEPAHVRPEGRPAISESASSSPVGVDPNQSTRCPRSNKKDTYEYGPTAGFIPTDYSNNSISNLSDTSGSLRSQRSTCFDFDLLPTNKATQRRRSTSGGDSASLLAGGANPGVLPLSSVVVGPSTPAPTLSLSPPLTGVSPFLGRAQYKCNQRTSPALMSSSLEKGTSTASAALSPTSSPSNRLWLTSLIPSFTAGVPAFAAPLTQVQSQVVKRAQWEVVVRAAFLAAVIAGVLIGVVVGVVP